MKAVQITTQTQSAQSTKAWGEGAKRVGAGIYSLSLSLSLSRKKFALNLAAVGLLVATSVSNAVAEESGWFAGAQLGYGGVSARAEYSQFAENIHTTTLDTYTGAATADSGWQSGGSLRYGILGGYKHFITPKFGMRFYGAFDYGTSEHKITGTTLSYTGSMVDGAIQSPNSKAKLGIWKLNLNVDALYDFISRESLDFGLFAGLSLGYVSGAKVKAAYNEAVRAHNDSLIAADYNIFSTLVYPYDE